MKQLLHRPIAVTMVMIAIVAIGMMTLAYIPVSLMPQIDIPKITVQCVKSGASVTEVEQQMITPLRNQLSQVAGLKDIESQSRIDAGTITLTFEPGTDMDILFIDVNEKIDRAMNNMPKDMERPKVIKASAMDIPAFYVDVFTKTDSVKGNSNLNDAEARNEKIRKFAQLSRLVQNVVVKRIEQLPQTAMVDYSGTVGTEILCVPDMDMLESMGFTTGDIEQAINNNNIVLGSLSVVNGIYRYSIHFDSQILNKEDIENIYIRHEGRMLQLKDLCSVIEKPAVRNGIVKHDTDNAVTLAVIKQNDAQMEDLQNSMNELLDNMRADYPDVEFAITRDQTQLLTYSINNLEWNLIIGALLACVILFLFNGGWKTPLLIMISIPLSLVLTLLSFYIANISLNIVSLSGLILGVGMIVDNAIIVIDNIKEIPLASRWEDGDTEGFATHVVNSVKEVFFPMLSSVLTTCSVFIPLIFLSGTAGALFYDQAMGVTIALFASLLVASVVVPVYYFTLYRRNVAKGGSSMDTGNRHTMFVQSKLEKWHSDAEKWTLRHIRTCLIGFGCALLLIAVLFPFMKKERMPEISHDDAIMFIDWNAGISIEENERRTDEVMNVAEGSLVTSTSMIGAQEFMLSHTKDITSSESVVYLKSHSEEGLDSVKEAIAEYDKAQYPKANVEFSISGNIFDLIFQTDKPDLEVRLQKPDGGRPTVKDAKAYVDSLRQAFPEAGIQPIATELNLQYVASPDMLAYYNVSYDRLYSRLRELVASNKVYEIASGSHSVPVIIGSGDTKEADNVLADYVMNNDGVEIPIANVIEVNKVENYKRLSASNEGEYYPVIISKASDAVCEAVMEKCDTMHSLRASYHGGYFDSREMIYELAVVLLVAVMLLYFILAAQFESIIQPLIILSEIVLDVSVVMLIIWILGESLNIMSMIGIVVMSGIIINDSILKVDTINRLLNEELRVKNEESAGEMADKAGETRVSGLAGISRASGISGSTCITANYSLLRAIMMAGRKRLRPIVMTSLTTILALLPFMHKGDMGSAMQYPLSLTLIVGMIIGTLVSLFFVPMVYYLIYKRPNNGSSPIGREV